MEAALQDGVHKAGGARGEVSPHVYPGQPKSLSLFPTDILGTLDVGRDYEMSVIQIF